MLDESYIFLHGRAHLLYAFSRPGGLECINDCYEIMDGSISLSSELCICSAQNGRSLFLSLRDSIIEPCSDRGIFSRLWLSIRIRHPFACFHDLTKLTMDTLSLQGPQITPYHSVDSVKSD